MELTTIVKIYQHVVFMTLKKKEVNIMRNLITSSTHTRCKRVLFLSLVSTFSIIVTFMVHSSLLVDDSSSNYLCKTHQRCRQNMKLETTTTKTRKAAAKLTTTTTTATTTKTHLSMYGEHQVQPSLANLPQWFNTYFTWHRNETQNVNNHTQYLVVECPSYKLEWCGGLSDRFRLLTLYLFIASQTNRVLCIHWARPYSLETFLQPPSTGMDWRCPDKLDIEINQKPIIMEPNILFNESNDPEYHINRVISDIQRNTDMFTSIEIQHVNITMKEYGFNQDITLYNFIKSVSEEEYMSLTVKQFQSKLDILSSSSSSSSSSRDVMKLKLFLQQLYKKLHAADNNQLTTTTTTISSSSIHHHYPIQKQSWWKTPPEMKHIFRVMFEPVEPIAKNIKSIMVDLGIYDIINNHHHNYTSVHTRIRYPIPELKQILHSQEVDVNVFDKGDDANVRFEGRFKDYALGIAKEALDCGYKLGDDYNVELSSKNSNNSNDMKKNNEKNKNPLLFFSDEIELVKDLTSANPGFNLDRYNNNILGIVNNSRVGQRQGRRRKEDEVKEKGNDDSSVLQLPPSAQPLLPLAHLDSKNIRPYEEYFPLFEDFLIMGGSQCVCYHTVSGFGEFGGVVATGGDCIGFY